MRPIRLLTTLWIASLVLTGVATRSVQAQQITGTPGLPSATTTVDGNYLPSPPAKFGGVINLDAKDSKPYWPPNIVPPKGAPNVLLIMTDYQGYGVHGTFVGVIPTPNMDRICRIGLRYKQFHYLGGISDNLIFGAAVADLRYLCTGFYYVYDLKTGKELRHTWRAPLSGRVKFSENPETCSVAVGDDGNGIHVECADGRRRLLLFRHGSGRNE